MHGHGEGRQAQVGLQHLQRVVLRETQRRAQRHDDRQVGGGQDRRHHREVRQRQPDARLQPQQVQRAGRLGVAGHEDEVQRLQRRAVAQRARLRVAAPQQHHVAFLQQRRAFHALQAGQVAEGQVEAAVFQRRGDGLGRELHRLDAHAGRAAADAGHQQRQELVGADVAHVHREAPLRVRGVEVLGLVQRHVDQLQRRFHLPCQLLGARRRPHAAGRAREQRVVQRQPQPREGVAHRRLRHAQSVGRAADAARRVHRSKHVQQVQVEVADMHAVHRT